MPDKDEIRIRKATNLYDLLDDGIANNSDIRDLVQREDAVAAESHATVPQRTQPEPETMPEPVERTARNWPGVLLGGMVFIAGTAAAIHPTAMRVWHSRARYATRSFFEYVTPERARFYGICIAIFGPLLLGCSLIRMPVADKES